MLFGAHIIKKMQKSKSRIAQYRKSERERESKQKNTINSIVEKSSNFEENICHNKIYSY